MDINKVIISEIYINCSKELLWENITNVDIIKYRFPWYFRILMIPKPIKAEIITEGVGGERIAYFDNGKKFHQKILTWDKNNTYSFSFNSEDNFKAGIFFNIFNGIFKIKKGTYFIEAHDQTIKIILKTDYTIQKKYNFLLNIPVYLILRKFQKYLLNTIKINSEN